MIDLWGNWWNLRQAGQIANQQKKTGQIEARVMSVDDRLERLMLINLSLWELLRENTQLSDEDLRRKIEEIDLRDGRLDGKLSTAPVACGNCGRNFSRRHTRCIYCGAAASGNPIG